MTFDPILATLVSDDKLSYKATASRTYWAELQGLQNDIQKLHRLVKRPDRIDQFYEVVIAINKHNANS